ncbi:MAG: pyrroloquinoline quinone biosynthesis protein PqqB [Acidobacteria bacterium]|nr:MAG: pyrroloquinoline quinone biosynthesis protein PqqB [Acidobacteriota bacterium]PYY10795.1 MAG: pyrroloquinoline quinone biosynthesis protein PqqB [Acidobacteriota bacterium]
MRVKVLGSAAGGGFPQWNCACRNCKGVRERTLNASARSQCQIAISSDDKDWFLLNASPDLRTQIESTPELHSRPEVGPAESTAGRNAFRHSPIAGVVLTGGDLDQVLGLFLLRELEPIHVYSTASVRRLLRDHNILFNMLSRQPWQSMWTDIVPSESFRLATPGSSPYIGCQPVALSGSFPAYVDGKGTDLKGEEAILGLVFESSHGGGRLAYFPTVPAVGDQLLELFDSCDLLLFDGTFWADDELLGLNRGFRSASEMGHLPMSGLAGSLNRLAKLGRPRKIFVHINNTNPVLDKDSVQYRQVSEAGWEVAEDGWEFRLQYPKPARAS